MNLTQMKHCLNWWPRININFLEKVLEAKENPYYITKNKHLSIQTTVYPN